MNVDYNDKYRYTQFKTFSQLTNAKQKIMESCFKIILLKKQYALKRFKNQCDKNMYH